MKEEFLKRDDAAFHEFSKTDPEPKVDGTYLDAQLFLDALVKNEPIWDAWLHRVAGYLNKNRVKVYYDLMADPKYSDKAKEMFSGWDDIKDMVNRGF